MLWEPIYGRAIGAASMVDGMLKTVTGCSAKRADGTAWRVACVKVALDDSASTRCYYYYYCGTDDAD